MQDPASDDPEINLWPRLTFHYGLSFEELARMPRWAVRLYLRALPGLVAENQLQVIQATSFPNMRKQDQQDIHRKLVQLMRRDKIYAEREPAKKVLDPEAERGALEAMGISVEVVSANA